MLLVLWRRWFNYQNILIIDLVWLILSIYFQDYRGWNWHVFFHVNILFSVRTILNSKYGETDKCHFSCIFKAFCFQYMYTKPQTRRNWQNASFFQFVITEIIFCQQTTLIPETGCIWGLCVPSSLLSLIDVTKTCFIIWH